MNFCRNFMILSSRRQSTDKYVFQFGIPKHDYDYVQIILFAEIINIKLITYGLNSIGLFSSIIMTHKSIYLVGLMAVGKSTVGKLLAEKLNRPFFDSDKEIEKNAGAEISWIFDVEGRRRIQRQRGTSYQGTFGEDRSDNRYWWWVR